jgi:hypothetical protein
MRKILTLAAVAATLGAALPALASEEPLCGDAPRAQWLSEDAVKAKVTAMSYDVRRIKVEDGCYEAYAIDPNGARVEVHLNPVTGDVVKSEDSD